MVIWMINNFDIRCFDWIVVYVLSGVNVWIVIIKKLIIFVKNIIKLMWNRWLIISERVIKIYV